MNEHMNGLMCRITGMKLKKTFGGCISFFGIGGAKLDPEVDKVFFCGKEVIYRKYTYILMNKPQGVVSATEDGKDKTVIDLLPDDMRKTDLFPCGRLDKNTLGLMLITDNGELAHKLLAPKSHVDKKYRFKARDSILPEDAKRFEGGLTLEDGYVTLPAKIELDDDRMGGVITLREGKYHQIKRMLEALDNKITYLERISFGPLTLDATLERGEWRYLSEEEQSALESHAK
jgi:16S rRNA pseudouridine516 synthase